MKLNQSIKALSLSFRFFSLTVLASGLLVATASADTSTPAGTVKEIVDKMKKDGNPAVVVDYVNWDRAFHSFPQEQKDKLNVKNSGELKTFFTEMLTHPSVMVKRQMEARMEALPEAERETARQTLASIEGKMVAKEAEIKERLKNTTYEIGESKIEGDKATVRLLQIYQAEKQDETVQLEKDGSRWLLPSTALGGQSTGAAAAQPAAANSPKTPPLKAN